METTTTSSTIWEVATDAMSGLFGMVSKGVETLWSMPHDLGKILIALPIIGLALGLLFKFFFRKRHI